MIQSFADKDTERLWNRERVRSIGVPPRRINEIVHGKRAVTADTALRLAKFFEMSPQFWLGLQTQYDLDVAEDKILAEIERIQPVQAASV